MKKVYIVVLALAVIVLAIYFVSKYNSTPDSWSTQTVQGLGTTIQYPTGWTFQIRNSDGDDYKEADASRIKPYTYVTLVLPGAKGYISDNDFDDEYIGIMPGTCAGVFEAKCNDGSAKDNPSVHLAIWTSSQNSTVLSWLEKITVQNLK